MYIHIGSPEPIGSKVAMSACEDGSGMYMHMYKFRPNNANAVNIINIGIWQDDFFIISVM